MDSEQDAPGSRQALMVAFKKNTQIHKIYQMYKVQNIYHKSKTLEKSGKVDLVD